MPATTKTKFTDKPWADARASIDETVCAASNPQAAARCAHCSRVTPTFTLQINLGACNRPACVLKSMRANM